MQRLDPKFWPDLRGWLPPENPCSLVAPHTIAIGRGSWWVDRWPKPQFAAAFIGGNMTLLGDPGAGEPARFGALIAELLEEWDRIFIDPAGSFDPLMRAAWPDYWLWPRIGFRLGESGQRALDASLAPTRRLTAADSAAVERLAEDIEWISDSVGGPSQLAATQTAFGAFDGDRLVSVASVFFVGTRYEELGVVTEADCRGRGLSTACATAVIADVRARNRTPCWSTTPDNMPSQRVAEKVGLAKYAEWLNLGVGDTLTGARSRPTAAR